MHNKTYETLRISGKLFCLLFINKAFSSDGKYICCVSVFVNNVKIIFYQSLFNISIRFSM